MVNKSTDKEIRVMRCLFTLGTVVLLFGINTTGRAECPLDHLIIGCNRDGVEGTADDKKLHVDCRQKYRDSGETEHMHWYYPLRQSIFASYPYRIGEPGFDAFQAFNPSAQYTYDPARAIEGTPEQDHSIVLECVAISPGLRAVHKEYPQFAISRVGDSFNHSYIYNLRGDPHIHMSYQATDDQQLKWIAFQLCDELADDDLYEPSEPFTVVFNQEPLAGDLVIDGRVDIADLGELSYYWLSQGGSKRNDYFERADANRDGTVDLRDLSLMASSWRDIRD
jgi:hypothetical protein